MSGAAAAPTGLEPPSSTYAGETTQPHSSGSSTTASTLLDVNQSNTRPASTLLDGNHTIAEKSTTGLKNGKLSDEPDAPIHELPTGFKFYSIMIGLFLTTYIVSLDATIVVPAIPVISNQFHDLSSVTWYMAAYLATSTAFQPVFGPFYRFNQKYTFLTCIFIFELGSLICAVAPGVNTFIGGRAVAGVGLAGGYVGVLTIIASICTLDQKTKWSNSIGAIYAAGAVSGPLIGGAFTTHTTWRWCFWINLPLGGVTMFLVFIFFREPKKPLEEERGIKAFLKVFLKVDWISVVLLLGALISLLFALQWGGLKYSWNNSRIIGTLIGFGLMSLLIIPISLYLKDRAMIPPSIVRKRTIMGAMICNFAVGAAYFSAISYVTIYYQVRGSSSIRSGVQVLPMIAGICFAMALGGGLAPVIGYVPPFLYFGFTIFCVALGCLTILDENTPTATWAAITFFVGFGSGVVWQMPFVASQTVLTESESEVGIAVVVFNQTLGGTILFGVNQAIYQNDFVHKVMTVPNLPNASLVAQSGVTAFRQIAPAEFIPVIERLAVDALRKTYYAGIVLAGLAVFVGAPLVEWKSIKPVKDTPVTHDEINREPKTVA